MTGRLVPRWFMVTAQTAARRVLADRSSSVVSLSIYVTVVVVISSLWRAAAEANDGMVVGYSVTALTWYIATSEAAYMTLSIRMIEEIGDDIASGAVAAELLRPAPVLGVRVASQLGRALPRLAACALLGVALCLIAVGRPPDLVGVALAVPALILAITCNLLAQHAVASASFWLRDARSTWFLYQKLIFISGGMLIPLEVLPDWLRHAAMALPFMTMAYVPGRLASGHVEPWLLVVQLGWLVVLGGTATVLFSAGERRLQTVGG